MRPAIGGAGLDGTQTRSGLGPVTLTVLQADRQVVKASARQSVTRYTKGMTTQRKKSTAEEATSEPGGVTRIYARISPALHERLVVYAMLTNQSKQDVIDKALVDYLTHAKLPPDQARKLKVFLED